MDYSFPMHAQTRFISNANHRRTEKVFRTKAIAVTRRGEKKSQLPLYRFSSPFLLIPPSLFPLFFLIILIIPGTTCIVFSNIDLKEILEQDSGKNWLKILVNEIVKVESCFYTNLVKRGKYLSSLEGIE